MTAGSTIGSAAAERTRAEIRHPGPGADGDGAQGIRLQEQRQAAAHQAARLHSLDPRLQRLRLSQALDGTWSQYQRETGNLAARRTNFADAVDFVGWYHSKTADTYGVARNDTYNLYLAYYLGWTAYGRGNWRRCRRAALCTRDRPDGPELCGAVARCNVDRAERSFLPGRAMRALADEARMGCRALVA